MSGRLICYGSEGWGFESLRARSVLRQRMKALTCGCAVGAFAPSGIRTVPGRGLGPKMGPKIRREGLGSGGLTLGS